MLPREFVFPFSTIRRIFRHWSYDWSVVSGCFTGQRAPGDCYTEHHCYWPGSWKQPGKCKLGAWINFVVVLFVCLFVHPSLDCTSITSESLFTVGFWVFATLVARVKTLPSNQIAEFCSPISWHLQLEVAKSRRTLTYPHPVTKRLQVIYVCASYFTIFAGLVLLFPAHFCVISGKVNCIAQQ